MSPVTGVEMPRSSKPKRDDQAVKIDRKLVQRAKIIASQKGITVAEYLSGLCKPGIERDWPKAVKQLESDGPEV